jgi:hypothetical protein
MEDMERVGGVATAATTDTTAGPGSGHGSGAGPEPEHDGPPGRSRRRWIVAIVAAAVVLVAAVALVVAAVAGDDGDGGEGSDGGSTAGADADLGTTLELSLGADDALASCLALDVAILADMSPAFAATATSVDGETVTLDVDQWYAGGDAESVVLQAPAGMQALIDGFDFEVGEQYLITATDGSVNYCGYSGLATPELTAAYDSAFPR